MYRDTIRIALGILAIIICVIISIAVRSAKSSKPVDTQYKNYNLKEFSKETVKEDSKQKSKPSNATQKAFDLIRYYREMAYFEGQRDYMNKDIRIAKEHGKYKWIKSPWDDAYTNISDLIFTNLN